MNMEYVPEPRLEPVEPKAVHQCSVCDEPIYEGEMAYNIPGYGWICEHCADMPHEEATA